MRRRKVQHQSYANSNNVSIVHHFQDTTTFIVHLTARSPLFPTSKRICLLWPNGWMIKMALGMEVGLGPGHIVLDGEPVPLPQKGGRAP